MIGFYRWLEPDRSPSPAVRGVHDLRRTDVTLIPIATFLAGSLLTLLLPVALLIALVVWYVKFVRRVPGTDESAESGTPAAAPEPAASAPPGGSPGEG